MENERDRLKHLLVILLETLSRSGGEAPISRTRIHEKVTAAGLDEEDVHDLLDWIEDQWQPSEGSDWDRNPLPESPSTGAFRFFGEADQEYLAPGAMGYLLQLLNAKQINRAQMEALLQYAALIAVRPLERVDLEPVLEQVLFRPRRPGLTGGASEGYESTH